MPSSGVQTCARSEEHTSELQSHDKLVCRLLLEKKERARTGRATRRGGGDLGADGWGAASRGHEPSRSRRVRSRPPPASALALAVFFFFKDTGPPEISPLSPPAALPT